MAVRSGAEAGAWQPQKAADIHLLRTLPPPTPPTWIHRDSEAHQYRANSARLVALLLSRNSSLLRRLLSRALNSIHFR